MAEKEPVVPPDEPLVKLKASKLDDLLISGWYLLRVCILLELSIYVQTAYMFYMMYAGSEPNIVSPADCTCAQYNNGSCVGEVKFEGQFDSVNLEWGYVCGQAKLVKTSMAIQVLGILVGSVVFGQLGENLGRRLSLLISMLGTTVILLVTPLSPGLVVLTVIRTIGGAFLGGQMVLALVMFMENCPKHMRLWIAMMLSWSPNIIINALVAFLSHDWRTLSLAIGVIATPGIILLFFFIQESPRWLLQKGRIDDAKEVMRKVYKVNRKELTEETLTQVFDNEVAARSRIDTNKSYSVFDILKHRQLALPLIVLCLCLCFTSFNAYGVLFSIEKLKGNMYINAAFNGFVRFLFNILFSLLESKFESFGRRAIHTICTVVVLIGLVLAILGKWGGVAIYTTHGHYIVLLVASMAAQLFLVISVCTNEVMPTPVRTIGFSLAQMFNRIGASLAPFLMMTTSIWSYMPYFIMFVLASIQLTSFYFVVPETRGKPMPERMPEKEDDGSVELQQVNQK